jgi:hypothetical protein
MLTTGAAMAQSGPTGFQSPSKNIACQYFDYDKQNVLRCDISAMETKPRRPADCDLDYGGAFEMNAKGPATRLCHGDTVMDNSLPVLGYGEVWQRGGFTCKSSDPKLARKSDNQYQFLHFAIMRIMSLRRKDDDDDSLNSFASTASASGECLHDNSLSAYAKFNSTLNT